MNPMPERKGNQLFSVHIWAEEIDDEQVEWRGRITSATSSEIVYFRTWDALRAYFEQRFGTRQEESGGQSDDQQ